MDGSADHKPLINLFLIIAGMSSALALLIGLVVGIVLSSALP
jgi:F0F1-type ATP synthase membrane subunit c/vacuolar-type H+-ATPase subunit K